MAVQRVTRYYAGKTSTGETQTKWHVTAQSYDPKELYGEIRTLCGYSINLSDQIVGRHRFSVARRPIGILCSKCEKKQSANGLEALRQAIELVTGTRMVDRTTDSEGGE